VMRSEFITNEHDGSICTTEVLDSAY